MPHYKQSSLIRELFLKGQPLVYAKGDVVMGNDAKPDGIYFIDTGFVKIVTISDTGEEFLREILGKGELFPVTWAYLGLEPDNLFYQAIASTTIWRLSRDTFNEFLVSSVALSHAFAQQVAQQFLTYSYRVENLEYKKAGDRVAYRLLFLAQRFGTQRGKSVTINAPLTHELVAESINLARESVSREMEKLIQQKLVKNNNHRIVINNIEVMAKRYHLEEKYINW